MRYLTVAMVGMMLLPSVALAQKTKFDFDKTADFAAYRTYALREGTKVGDPVTDNPIIAAIEAQLAAKGLTKSETPDLAVVYHFAVERHRDITSHSEGSSPYGWHWGGGWEKTGVRLNFIYEGTLVIDIADVKKNEIVWRGIVEGEINPTAKPERRNENIRKVVEKILSNYPPPPKK